MSAKHPRTGKYIVPAGRTWAPASIVSVICETESKTADRSARLVAETLTRVHVAECHKMRGTWSGTLYRSFATGGEFHDWLEAWATHRRRTYVYTPHVERTLVLTDWWNRLEQSGCKLVRNLAAESEANPSTPIASKKPTPETREKSKRADVDVGVYKVQTYLAGVQTQIVRYARWGRAVQWCSHGQYLESDEETIARSIDFKWRNDTSIIFEEATIHRHPVDRAFLWCRWHQRMSDWWLSVGGGPWSPTTAGLAWSFLRCRLKPRTVLHHADERAGQLELEAMHGGRRSVFYVGNVGDENDWRARCMEPPDRSPHGTLTEPIDHWDVQSMYPFLLRNMPFPIERISYLPRASVPYLLGLCESVGVIARVVIRTDTAEYPAARGHGSYFPIGTFTTTLAGPELLLAAGLGEIQEVQAAALYKMGRPFRAAIDPLLRLRSEYGGDALKGWRQLTKAMMVKMSGRLAPNRFDLIPRPTTPALVPWGEWRRRDGDSGEVREYLARSGMVWERRKSRMSIRPMGAAYTFLTAYGRVMMRGYRQLAPQRTVLAQDTDGFWALRSARSVLDFSGDAANANPGDLTWRDEFRAARFWGPQHYWVDGRWTLSGMSSPTYVPELGSIRSQLAHSGLTSRSSPPLPVMLHTTYDTPLRPHLGHGHVDAEGWVHPPLVGV